MELKPALSWAASRRNAALITLRKDGRAQSSDIVLIQQDGSFLVSLTNGRAKTANIRRDNRVVLHFSEPSSYSYLSFDCLATLSAATEHPDDKTADALVDYYRTLAGEHPNWDEYRQAMIEEGRLIATITPQSVVGQTN